MSDDDFGDFEEATEEVKVNEPEIITDNLGRPLQYMPSTSQINMPEYFNNLCSIFCEKHEFFTTETQKIQIAQEENVNFTDSTHLDLKQEYQEYLETLPNRKSKEKIKTQLLGKLLMKQGEEFVREIWPNLSIRNVFLKNCSINEGSNGVSDTLVMVTETEVVSPHGNISENKKCFAKEFLGYDLPDLSFMIASSIQWPSEFLKQI